MHFATLTSALLVAAAGAVPNDALMKVSTSIASKQTCISKLRAAPSSVSPLPTRTKTSMTTISSTTTTCGSASTTTVTITPDAVTSTTIVNTTSTLQLKPRLVTAPAGTAATACSSTTTITIGTTTVYTGSYNGTLAKRTASPLDRLYPVGQRRSSLNVNMFNNFGQRAMSGVSQKPVAVDCVKQVTTYYLTTSVIAEQPATETVTADTPTVFVTQAEKIVATPTAPVSITSTTLAPGSANATVSAGGLCTVTEAASTTTQHLKCAPTNLISSVNGKGIGQTGGSSANTRGLAAGSDPSACCQLCVDTDDDDGQCAASQDDPDAGNCFLWYTSPSCGVGLKYSDGGKDLAPGAGFLIQTGCGTVEAVDSF
ncbi:Hypothetical predicted protein [Lecanosticta acicola]|uniref:Ca2+-modulated nonselective cation channel polycystin n=1 Tax=Lecanosticta acicola TaxID=111012 RepID=A0AAI9EDZ5_9PEZI|nr:Hypothetical predicted protein [Lecanosticta acicola]